MHMYMYVYIYRERETYSDVDSSQDVTRRLQQSEQSFSMLRAVKHTGIAGDKGDVTANTWTRRG